MNKIFSCRVRSYAAALIAALVSVTVVAASSNALQPRVHVKVNNTEIAAQSAIYLGIEKGYFAAEGLDIELVSATNISSAEKLLQLSANVFDLVTFAPSAALFNSLAAGANVVGITPLNVVTANDRSSGITVRQDLIDSGRYKNMADLKGLTIGVVTFGGTGEYNLLRALEQAGLSQVDVKTVEIGLSETNQAMAEKKVDATFQVEPYIADAKKRGIGSLMISAGQITPGGPTTILYANADFARKNSDAIKRFTAVVLKATREYLAAMPSASPDHSTLINALVRYTRTKNPAEWNEVALPGMDKNLAIEISEMDRLQDFFIRSGKQKIRIEGSSKLFDPQYLDYAFSRYGKL